MNEKERKCVKDGCVQMNVIPLELNPFTLFLLVMNTAENWLTFFPFFFILYPKDWMDTVGHKPVFVSFARIFVYVRIRINLYS